MIKYCLRCASGHNLEAWVRSSETFDRQSKRQLVACPDCGHDGVERQIMAPAILKNTRPSQKVLTGSAELDPMAAFRAAMQVILANTEDVGQQFAHEARKIHEGETENRPIRGVATMHEAQSLADEGIRHPMLRASPLARGP